MKNSWQKHKPALLVVCIVRWIPKMLLLWFITVIRDVVLFNIFDLRCPYSLLRNLSANSFVKDSNFNFKNFSMQNFNRWAFAVVWEGYWLSSKPLRNSIKLAMSSWVDAQLLTDCIKVNITFLTSFMVYGITQYCCFVFIHLAVEFNLEWWFPLMILCMFYWKLKYSQG